ncbi:MAG: family 78 glycoside hydrolase catalytic domain [Clostridia bacterium]|nr:family 78 glycoside hydrolase catalytic domain [Clostridia bacterium]
MLKIDRLWMDYFESPEGVEEEPVIGWVLESDGTNVMQTAYQLQAAKDPSFEAIVWDSGRVESDESAHVQLPSLGLENCRRYYVRVRAWSQDGETGWKEGSFLTGMADRRWQAKFITAENDGDWSNSAGTYLRREWEITKPVKEAYLCATALGVYHLYLNGKKVGEDQLAPGWTSYHKHLCYQTYDVTKMLHSGGNAVGAHLGAGWFKGMMGFIWERNNYGDRTALLMQLTIRYEDGTEETVATDESWLGCASPVTFSEIYDGEYYDARLEQPGWSEPGFAPAMGGVRQAGQPKPERDTKTQPLTDEQKIAQRTFAQQYQPQDILWRHVNTVDYSLEALQPQPGCRVGINEKLPVKEIIITPEGDTVLDFGQNLSGWVRFRVRGKKGDVAHIRCFETLDAAGNAYFANLRSAKAEVRYVCRGEGEEVFDESFSFQGFRYAKVEKWPCEVRAEDFTACAVYSRMTETGSFRCSNPLLNQLQSNIEWSLRGNFLDIPTDCPQRDERMGWTGDTQIFCRTSTFIRNVYPFFRKWLKDVAYDQTEEGGVPHIVPNQLQFHFISDWLLGQGTHSAAAWADVAVVNPWMLYLAYGDKRILEDQFESMRKWINFMRDHARDYIWNYLLQFGDWVALDAEEGSYYGATPNDLTCTAYYAYSTSLFVKVCRVLGKDDMADEYQALYEKIADKFRRTFLDDEGVMTVQTQTSHILPLVFGLIPEKGRQGTVEGLKRLLDERDGHLVTGFMGTPYFCHALSENGCKKEAYDLLLKEDFPSWLYQVKCGATTIWEHWDGLKPDGTMWSPDMNSFNHYAYGAIGDWLYRVLAGLDNDENHPGYKHAVLHARTGGGLEWAEAALDTVYGRLSSRWDAKDGRILRTMQVPVNATASIILEEGAEDVQSGITFTRNEDGLWQAEVGSGLWTVSYALTDEQ